MIIDGTTEPDFAGSPVIELEGPGHDGQITFGLFISADSSTVRGLVINNFQPVGILVAGNGNTIEGNYIGTDVSGTAARENFGDGLVVGGDNNIIGGTTAAARNIISGNEFYGMTITPTATGNQVLGNFIGTDVTGTLALANGSRGVNIYGAGNTIGGTTAAARNIISGNGGSGINIGSGPVQGIATGNQVLGNFIGTDVTGTAALGNRDGVFINDPSNTVGPDNVISGNADNGVAISGSTATGNQVYGNYIGTDVTGAAALGNRDGVASSAPSTTVGPDNVISGNGSDGVRMGSDSTVSGNKIGTDAAGTTAIANGGDGVVILGSSTTVGPDNLISGNGGDGVAVTGSTATGNTITENSIHSNGGAGIHNASGGNTELATPIVLAVGSASGTSDCASCTIEVFSDEDDEGKTFHGTATTAAGPCPCAWSFGGVVTGPSITATVTDGSGNTSEFSCPNPPTTWLVPVGDDDCDGFTTTIESFVGTDPLDACAADSGSNNEPPPDQWPVDMNDNQRANTLDVAFYVGKLNSFAPGPPYTARLDLTTNGVVNTLDLAPFVPLLNKVCSTPP